MPVWWLKDVASDWEQALVPAFGHQPRLSSLRVATLGVAREGILSL